MAKKELTKIILQTVPNGYTLTVGDTECMYFNELDLLAGFMAHVGLGETANMEKGTILSMLFSAMMGDVYTDAVTTLKQRVGLLTNQYNTTIERMDKAIEFVTQAEKTISALTNRLDRLEQEVKSTSEHYAENRKMVDDATRKLSEIEKRSNDVSNSLANTATIIRTLEEAAKVSQKNKAGSEDGDSPSKSDTDGTQPDSKGKTTGKEAKTKNSGGRKKNDEAILKSIEKKGKHNPN